MESEVASPPPEETGSAAGRRRVGGLSSLLVNPWTIVLCFAASVIANVFNAGAACALFLFFALLGLLSRFWGLHALKKVRVDASGENTSLFAGQKAVLHYRVENGKLLPLPWLEVCQDLPLNSCVEPEDGFERYDLSEMETGVGPASSQYRRRLAFLMGYQTLTFSCSWRARRRGIYQLSRLSLRSGDGFGLTQSAGMVELPNAPALVVWPRRVEVLPERFFRSLWSGQTGPRGVVEDVTVLKSERDYRPGDAWKRIDWRQAARTDELSVRQFETIQPRTIHFIVDGASFLGLSEGNGELEEALSILASLYAELCGAGMLCGLSLPQTGLRPCADLLPEPGTEPSDLLFQLAAFDGDTATGLFSDQTLQGLQNTAGQMYLIAHSPKTVRCGALLRCLDPRRLTALLWDCGGTGPDFPPDCPVLPLQSFRKGGGAG